MFMRMIMTKPVGHIKPVNKWRDLIYDHANFQFLRLAIAITLAGQMNEGNFRIRLVQ
jgi:hypothetical protein